MFRVTLKGLMAKKFRLALTSLAVVLGVAFMAGTFVLTDTLGNVFDSLFGNATQGVDAVVRAREPFKADTGPGSSGQQNRPPIPENLQGEVAQVDGVARVQGVVQGVALVFDKQGDAIQHAGPTIGVAWFPPGQEVGKAFSNVRGHRPRAPDEVALDRKTADDGDLKIGDTVKVSFLTVPPEEFTLVGTFEFGGNENGLAGATMAAFTPETAQRVTNRIGQWDRLDVKSDDGVSQTEVRDNIRTALKDAGQSKQYEALTADAFAKEQANDIKDNLSFFNIFLLVFALIALFVGAFIIYNTFAITVSQRARELGLLRALGASGGQVVGSVALEAIVVGIFSSIVGLILGIAIVKPLEGLFSLFGADLPSGPLQIEPRTIIVSLLVGTLITFVSAISPARKAARIPPIAALRDQATAPNSGRRRYIWGGVLAGAGLVALFIGLFGDQSGDNGAILVGVAALLVFIGVAMLSPLVARPAARVLAYPAERIKSVTGMLAQQNAMRSPRRTASTAAALDDRPRAGQLHRDHRRVLQGHVRERHRQPDPRRLRPVAQELPGLLTRGGGRGPQAAPRLDRGAVPGRPGPGRRRFRGHHRCERQLPEGRRPPPAPRLRPGQLRRRRRHRVQGRRSERQEGGARPDAEGLVPEG